MTVEPDITRPGGNVFEDLGLENSAAMKLKLRLAVTINRDLKERGLTQVQAADLLAEQQPRISALANYKLSGFSLEKLFGFVSALGHDMSLGIGRSRANHHGHIQVREMEAV